VYDALHVMSAVDSALAGVAYPVDADVNGDGIMSSDDVREVVDEVLD
jgi:hypothetical protein